MEGTDEVYFEGVNQGNVDRLVAINQVIFPIRYSPKVYQDIVACGEISQIANLKGSKKTIGGISCRLENTPNDGPTLYIITLGVLAPFRSLGLGSKLLSMCIDTVESCLPEVTKARLHVQINNEDAIRFYERHGFAIVETVQDYYIKVEPRDAVVLELKLNQIK